MANVGYRSHTDPLFKKLEILKLEDLYSMNLKCFMQRFDIEEVPDSFIGMFSRLSALRIRTLSRYTALDYHVKNPKSVFLSNFPTIKLPEAWNSLPLKHQAIIPKTTFNNTLKYDFLDTYHDNVNCFDRSCPDCFK